MGNKIEFKEIINILKENGFVFQNSEIYNGLANTWDFGPLGSLMKDNIKSEWKKHFIFRQPNNYLLDSAIFSNPKVWEASGHVDNFNDPLIDCKECKTRYRADNLLEKITNKNFDGKSLEELQKAFDLLKDFKCSNCKKRNWTKIRKFQLMFKINQGITTDKEDYIYLRPELAQGIFINFKNMLNSTRSKLPMGIGQIGKSFRNEITPGNFVFRTKEFEQMELEFFVHPKEANKWFDYYVKESMDFLINLGLNKSNIIKKTINKDDLAHYSKATTDIDFKFPFGTKELMGIANRGDYDLNNHQKKSKKDLTYLDPFTNERYLPFIIEPSIGVDRLLLALILDSIVEENNGGETRIVLKLKKELSPYKIAILPLVNKLDEKAIDIYNNLKKELQVPILYDKSGSIGKRYRRQDAIGTPICITVDYDTLDDFTVTLRDRDTMEQKRIKIEDIKKYL